MNELRIYNNSLPSMRIDAIEKVKYLESECAKLPQIDINTSHIIHGGMYARTIVIPEGVFLTGALIKIATILIIQGAVSVYIGEDTLDLDGYYVLPASANRKQAFFAKTDTYLTMIFPTKSKNVEESENEFTDEVNILMSRENPLNNNITITGE